MKIRGTTLTTPIARHAIADDTAVSDKAWSSKNIIDRLCPAFTESGTVVTCEPLEGYPLSVTPIIIAPVNDDGWKDVSNWTETGFDYFGDHNEIYYVFDAMLQPGTYTLRYQWLQDRADYEFFQLQAETAPNTWTDLLDQTNLYNGILDGTITFSLDAASVVRIRVDVMVETFVLANVNPQELFGRLDIYSGTTVPSDETATIITQCGKNLVAYPYKEKTKTIYGITFMDNGDGSVTINGTSTGSATYFLANRTAWDVKKGVSYIAKLHKIAGSYSGGAQPAWAVNYYAPGQSEYWGWLWAVVGGSESKPCPSQMNTMATYLVIQKGTTCNNLVVKPQLEVGTVATAYEPYKASKTFTPGETIPAIAGVNTLYADVGTITVEGRKDPVAEMEKLKNAILALGGNV